MRYVISRYRLFEREEAYRIYVTDSLRSLFGDENTIRYIDLFSKKHVMTEEESNQKGEEIKQHFVTKMKQMGKEKYL